MKEVTIRSLTVSIADHGLISVSARYMEDGEQRNTYAKTPKESVLTIDGKNIKMDKFIKGFMSFIIKADKDSKNHELDLLRKDMEHEVETQGSKMRPLPDPTHAVMHHEEIEKINIPDVKLSDIVPPPIKAMRRTKAKKK